MEIEKKHMSKFDQNRSKTAEKNCTNRQTLRI